MATIGPVALTITRKLNGRVQFNLKYSIEGSNHDKASEMSYREVCQVIGDDTPGDGTDDPLGCLVDEIISFSKTSISFERRWALDLPLSSLDEDGGGILPEADEIRVLVTITPILPTHSSRESNLVTISTTGVIKN